MAKILVVEDDDFLTKMYDVGLKHEGFDVVIGTDGEQGIALAKQHKPDVILLDLIMPKKNGFEVLEELKKDPTTKDIPVYILSNLSQQVDVERVKELGAVSFLQKDSYTVKQIAEFLRTQLAHIKPVAPVAATPSGPTQVAAAQKQSVAQARKTVPTTKTA